MTQLPTSRPAGVRAGDIAAKMNTTKPVAGPNDNDYSDQASVISTLERGLMILDAVAQREGMTVDQLARTVVLPISTLYRYVRYLREVGFLTAVDGTYYLGPRRHQTRAVAHTSQLAQAAQPVLRTLQENTGEAAILTVRVHLAALTIDRLLPLAYSPLSFQRGRLKPLYAGASATVLLAWAPPQTIADVVNGKMKRITAATRTEQSLMMELARIRSKGYAVSHGEVDPLMSGIAAPVFRNGACLCAVSVAGLTARLSGQKLDRTVDAVLRAAADLQAVLS